MCVLKKIGGKKWNFFLFFYLNLTFFPSPDNLCFYSEKILFNLWNQVIVFLFCKKICIYVTWFYSWKKQVSPEKINVHIIFILKKI